MFPKLEDRRGRGVGALARSEIVDHQRIAAAMPARRVIDDDAAGNRRGRRRDAKNEAIAVKRNQRTGCEQLGPAALSGCQFIAFEQADLHHHLGGLVIHQQPLPVVERLGGSRQHVQARVEAPAGRQRPG